MMEVFPYGFGFIIGKPGEIELTTTFYYQNGQWLRKISDATIFETEEQAQAVIDELTQAKTQGDGHWSDCAMHNEPAYPNGPCNCGVSKKDPGAHYRHNLRVKVTQEDLERGHVDVQIDPYRIALTYNMTDHMEFFILKKNLRMGSAHKNKRQELLDIIDAANRRIEILDEVADEVRT